MENALLKRILFHKKDYPVKRVVLEERVLSAEIALHTFIMLSSFSRTLIHILLLVKGPKSSQKWFGSANLLFSSTLFELHHTLSIFLPCHWSIAILHTE